MVTVNRASVRDYAAWDEFLKSVDDATLFHTSKWGEFLENYSDNFNFILILAKDESGQILGGLPLARVRHAPFVSSLVSIPFGDGGIISLDNITFENLLNYNFGKLPLAIKIIHSQIHNINFEAYRAAGFKCLNNGINYYLDLSQSIDEIWRNYDKRMRTAVRKAKTEGVTIKEPESNEELAAIEQLYTETMQRTSGTLQLLSMLRILYNNNDKNITRFFLAEYKKEIIAFSALLLFNKSAYYWLAGSSRDYQKQNPNNLLQHFSIDWLKANGFSYYCLGGANPRRLKKNEGLDMFKRGWGGVQRPSNILIKYLNPLGQTADQLYSIWGK